MLQQLHLADASARPTEEQIHGVRQLFEDGLTAVGLHMTQGALFWQAYRSLERQLYERGIVASPERVTRLFERQLGVPHVGIDATRSDYEAWLLECGAADEATLSTVARPKQAEERATRDLAERLPLEEQLSAAAIGTNARRTALYAYIQFELERDDPARVQSICERAAPELCIEVTFWSMYGAYMDRRLPGSAVAVAVYAKAVRNCPWAASLWVASMHALERAKRPRAELDDLLQAGLRCTTTAADQVQLWLAYLDYLRRSVAQLPDGWTAPSHEPQRRELWSAFSRAHDHVLGQFGGGGDAMRLIRRYHARLAAYCCHDMREARHLWEGMLRDGLGRLADMWLEYVQLERAYGNAELIPKLVCRAVAAAAPAPVLMRSLISVRAIYMYIYIYIYAYVCSSSALFTLSPMILSASAPPGWPTSARRAPMWPTTTPRRRAVTNGYAARIECASSAQQRRRSLRCHGGCSRADRTNSSRSWRSSGRRDRKPKRRRRTLCRTTRVLPLADGQQSVHVVRGVAHEWQPTAQLQRVLLLLLRR